MREKLPGINSATTQIVREMISLYDRSHIDVLIACLPVLRQYFARRATNLSAIADITAEPSNRNIEP
jgi:hypothetical protein